MRGSGVPGCEGAGCEGAGYGGAKVRACEDDEVNRDRDRRPAVFQSSRPLVFAHRGGAKLAPENTQVAFESGLAHGADGLELDVHLSADGLPVVIHDATLDRTTDRTGPVGRLTADELARVDAGHRFERDGAWPFRGQGIGVPTLESVLRRWASTRVIVEIKGAEQELAREVSRIVRATAAVDRVCVGSFHRVSMEVVRAEAPEVVTSASQPEVLQVLHRSWVRWPFAGRRRYSAMQVPRSAGRLRVVSPAFINHVHRGGQVLQVWVVDAADDTTRLLDWGVDGVISDRPDLTVPARNVWAANGRATETRKHGTTS